MDNKDLRLLQAEIYKVFIEKIIIIEKEKYTTKAFKYSEKLNAWLQEESNANMWNTYINCFSSEYEAWYCLLRKTIPNDHKCEICGKQALFINYKNKDLSYSRFCSKECRSLSREPKKKATCLEKYGVESPNQSVKVQGKRKQTCLEKYGVDHYNKTEESKEKHKQTCLKRYNVENYSSTSECREKVKQTCLEKYGVENYNQTEESREKHKQTCLEKYGVEHHSKTEEFKKKYKQTCFERYDVENANQSPMIREKTKQTCLRKYGVESYFQTGEFRKRYKQTCLEKYGVENYNQTEESREKHKQTCLEKYGVEYISQVPEIRGKVKQTCLEKYGVENYTQTEEYAKTAHKRWLVEDKSFDSKWEIYYYYYLKDNNIPFEEQIGINYTDLNNKKHTYFCDFKRLDTNELIEIKGGHLLNESQTELETPYYKGLTEEEIIERTVRDKAKQECMKENNVIVLSDVNFFLELEEQFKQNHPDLQIIKN